MPISPWVPVRRDFSLTGSELQKITAADLIFQTDGSIAVAGIVAGQSANIDTVTLNSIGSVTFNTVALDSNLTVTTENAVSQTGSLVVAGNSILATTTDDRTITLNDPANSLVGTVTVTTRSYTTNNAHVVLDNGSTPLQLDTSTIAGNFTITNGADVIQSGSLTVAGNLIVYTDLDDKNITLDNQNNNIDATVSFATTGTGNVVFDNGSQNVDINGSQVAGSMTIAKRSGYYR